MTTFKGRFADELSRWAEHPYPKPTKQTFYWRLASGYAKEEWILLWKEWEKIVNAKWRRKNMNRYVGVYGIKEEKPKEVYSWIDITYPPDVARVFKEEFENVIDNIEDDMYLTWNKEKLEDLNSKLNKARREYNIFLQYNNI